MPAGRTRALWQAIGGVAGPQRKPGTSKGRGLHRPGLRNKVWQQGAPDTELRPVSTEDTVAGELSSISANGTPNPLVPPTPSPVSTPPSSTPSLALGPANSPTSPQYFLQSSLVPWALPAHWQQNYQLLLLSLQQLPNW